jgi:hypothetical protein
VRKLKKELAGKVFVVDCMVDRVCTGRTIQKAGVDVQVSDPDTQVMMVIVNITFSTRLRSTPHKVISARNHSQRRAPFAFFSRAGRAVARVHRGA